MTICKRCKHRGEAAAWHFTTKPICLATTNPQPDLIDEMKSYRLCELVNFGSCPKYEATWRARFVDWITRWLTPESEL